MTFRSRGFHSPTRRVRPPILAAALLCASLALVSCAGLTGTRSEPPGSRQGFVQLASSEINGPLLPGHERTDIALEPADSRQPLVMVAISGGGSRSAYYAACVMEHLSRIEAPGSGGRSFLDTVRVVSTVSAGSLAAGWYLTHYDERGTSDFFARFKSAMAQNLQWKTYGHMVTFPPLALQLLASSVTRTDLLAGTIQGLMGGRYRTFDDLREQETRTEQPAPVFIVNGTVYNSGQRLVLTNLPPERFPTILGVGSFHARSSSKDAGTLGQLVQPLTLEDLGSDAGSVRLGQAIATSAAYPIILAPVRYRVFPDRVHPRLFQSGRANNELLASKYVYVADGGVYENNGLDSLISLTRTISRNRPILYIIIDASQKMETMKIDTPKVWGPASVIGRLYDIGTLRPLALYGSVLQLIHNPDRVEAVMIRMESSNPETEAMLKNIPTLFKLSPSHREALERAAAENVESIRGYLQSGYGRLAAGRSAPRQAAKGAR